MGKAKGVVSVVVMAGVILLLAASAPAVPKTVLGSVAITVDLGAGAGFVPPTTELTGFAVIANQGLEKTITQQIPPFVFPVFMDGDGPPNGLKILNRNLDTTLVLTNASGAPVTVRITLRDADGVPIPGATVDLPLGAGETTSVFLSSLL